MCRDGRWGRLESKGPVGVRGGGEAHLQQASGTAMGAMVPLRGCEDKGQGSVLRSRRMKEVKRKVRPHRDWEEQRLALHQSQHGLRARRERSLGSESGGYSSLAVLSLWVCLGHGT